MRKATDIRTHRRKGSTPRLILGIVGEKSSGKSAVFQYLRKKRGVRVARFSDVLNDLLLRLHLDKKNRFNQGQLGEALRATFGVDILTRVVLADALNIPSRVAVLDGIRKLGELRALKKHRNFKLMYITAPARIRYARAQRRNERRDDRISFQEFLRIEKLPHEIEIPKIGRRADARIDNGGSKRELFAKVDATLKRFGVKV